MILVKNAFSLSSVVRLDSASDASVFAARIAGPGAEPAGPEATDSDSLWGHSSLSKGLRPAA
jgi:hypothetical protein